MAHRTLTRATLDQITVTTDPRRPSQLLYSNKRNYHVNNNVEIGTCCCGGGHHGCGCGCKGCVCRLTYFKDESNVEAYGGEGGRRRGMTSPDIDRPDRASRYDSSNSSLRTADSMSNGSFENSFEARGHLHGQHPATANININGVGHQFGPRPRSEEEEDGHYAHLDFLTPANSHDGGDSRNSRSFDDEDSFMLGSMDDSTLARRGSHAELGDRSLLNREYESQFNPPSATQSQILVGTGTHFVMEPLRLT